MQCIKELMNLIDSFDALNGKWKLPVLQYLYNRQDELNSFKKIVRGIDGLSDKMLAKELRQLEENSLIKKFEDHSSRLQVDYKITAHGKTAIPLIKTLVEWGRTHREITKNKIKNTYSKTS